MPVLIFKRLHMPEINPSRKTPALIFLIFIKNAALNPPAQKKTLFINTRGNDLNQKHFLEFMNFFAYLIHTEVGNHCAGAKVNGRIVPLNTPLKNGKVADRKSVV